MSNLSLPSLWNRGLRITPGGLGSFTRISQPAEQEPDLGLEDFTRPDVLRKNVYDKALSAIQGVEPTTNSLHHLSLTNVRYVDPDKYSLADEKKALLEGRSLYRRIRGTWQLADAADPSKIISSKDITVARVPYVSHRGTIIRDGTDYMVKNQQRLMPGIFTRQQASGEIESHVNILPGKGPTHRYHLDPVKQLFYLTLGAAKIPVFPLLRTLGVHDDQMKEAWGPEIYAANLRSNDPKVLDKLYGKFVRNPDMGVAEEVKRKALQDAFAKMEMDPDVTQHTMGRPVKTLDPQSVLDITKRLLAVSKGEADTDDRDSLAYQRIMSFDDMIGERLSRDAGGFRRMLLWKASREKNLDGVPSGALTKQIDHVILSSGIANALEQINPADLIDKRTKLTRLGDGGIGSERAVPDEARAVQPSYLGFVDLLRTPESSLGGVDSYLAKNVKRGKDGKLYTPVIDRKTGQTVWKSPQELARASVRLQYDPEIEPYLKRLPAVSGGRMRLVPKDEIQYELPSFTNAFNQLSNLIPGMASSKGQRDAGGSRMLTQAMPMIGAEAPWVQAATPEDPNRSFEEEYGRDFGAIHANQPGRVVGVTPDGIKVRYDDGKSETLELYNNFPFSRKTSITNTPLVKPGDTFTPGQVLAKSNYTNDKGQVALGLNARVAYMIAPGAGNFEDAIAVSESFARRATSEHTYQHGLSFADKNVKAGLDAYISAFPATFSKEMLSKFSDNGVIKPGTQVAYGDPLILAVRKKEISKGKLHRKNQVGFADASETWDHHATGVVTDVAHTPKGINVIVKSQHPLEVGDKLSGSYFDKGVVGRVIPDEDMPKTSSGEAPEILMNPLGILTRCYDEKTEFLTDRGWRFGKEITPTEKFMCFHPWTRKLYLMRQLMPFNASHYEGPMLGYEGLLLDFLVTPNHRMWTRCAYPGAPWQEETAERIYGKNWVVPTAGEPVDGVRSDFELPHMEEYNPKDRISSKYKIVIDAGDWAELLGWYMAEGNADRKGTHISQSPTANPKNCKKIGKLLDRLPFAWNYQKANKQFHISSMRLSAYLASFGKCDQKSIPDWVFRQPFEVRQRFLDAYWAGDGRKTKVDAGRSTSDANSRSEQLIDDLQRLHVYQGISASKGYISAREKKDGSIVREGWRCGRHDRKERMTYPESSPGWYQVDYKGMIYCPTVPTGYIVTRRNGKLLIAGNSNATQAMAAVLGKIAAKTGQPYKIPAFRDTDDLVEFTYKEMKKYGVKDKEDFYDPQRGIKIPGILYGNRHIMKLHHTSESKLGGRGAGEGGYTSAGEPSKGGGAASAKRVGLLSANALLSHGAFNTLRDASAVRGQRNEDFWLRFIQGHAPTKPEVPQVYQKFISDLKGSGINVLQDGSKLHIMALANKDIDALSEGREISNGNTLDYNRGMEPVKGGLFDMGLTGGVGGKQWSHAKLPEPYPSPVMEEPIRHILGLTQKKFEDVIAGTEELNNERGPAAIAKALDGIDLDQEIAQARITIKSGKKTARDLAVRKLKYLQSAKNQGLHPRDWMWDKVPIIPPIFRPVSMMAGSKVPLVADANFLYKELLDSVGNHNSLKEVSSDLSNERAAIYQSMKAVVGLGDPIHPKLVEKGIKGILAQTLGSSPKFSSLQRRLISSTVDNVGRGTITPDSSLDMDQIGIPEEKAWDIYRNFIARRLVRRGMPASAALDAVDKKSHVAREELVKEMAARPVMVDRAPVWWKFGVMAYWPQLTKDKTIKVSPLIVAGHGADFDGNCLDFDTEIEVDFIKKDLYNAPSVFVEELKERTMRLYGKQLVEFENEDRVTVRLPIGEFPRIGKPVRDRNGALVYSVPEGVKIRTGLPGSGSFLAPVTKLTVEEDCQTVTVTTRTGHRVVVSDNASLAVYCPKTGGFTKVTPQEAAGQLVPVVRKMPSPGDRYTSTLGWWYGAFVSDGWVSERYVGYAKVSELHRRTIVETARREISENFYFKEYEGKKGPNKHADSTKIHLFGEDIRNSIFNCYNMAAWNKQPKLRGALFKKLPDELLQHGSEECLLGVLAGMLEGDGTIGWGSVTAAGTARKVFRISTSSPYLVASIRRLGLRLGFRISVTETPPREGANTHTAYSVLLCVRDIQQLMPRLPFITPGAKKFAKEFAKLPVVKDQQDLVPLPRSVAAKIRESTRGYKKEYAAINSAMRNGYVTRDVMRAILDALDFEDAPDDVVRYKAMVEDREIWWDKIVSIEDAGKRQVFDLAVPETKVFAVASGLIVYDTMQFHVPIEDSAAHEMALKMLPSKNLINTKDLRSPIHLPKNEFAGGLYELTQPADNKRTPHTFSTTKDALAAYKRGEVKAGDPVVILKP